MEDIKDLRSRLDYQTRQSYERLLGYYGFQLNSKKYEPIRTLITVEENAALSIIATIFSEKDISDVRQRLGDGFKRLSDLVLTIDKLEGRRSDLEKQVTRVETERKTHLPAIQNQPQGRQKPESNDKLKLLDQAIDKEIKSILDTFKGIQT